MLSTKKNIIIALLIILVILFFVTLYLLYNNFYFLPKTQLKSIIKKDTFANELYYGMPNISNYLAYPTTILTGQDLISNILHNNLQPNPQIPFIIELVFTYSDNGTILSLMDFNAQSGGNGFTMSLLTIENNILTMNIFRGKSAFSFIRSSTIPNFSVVKNVPYYCILAYLDVYRVQFTINNYTIQYNFSDPTDPIMLPIPFYLGVGYSNGSSGISTTKGFNGTVTGLMVYPSIPDLSNSPLYKQYLKLKSSIPTSVLSQISTTSTTLPQPFYQYRGIPILCPPPSRLSIPISSVSPISSITPISGTNFLPFMIEILFKFTNDGIILKLQSDGSDIGQINYNISNFMIYKDSKNQVPLLTVRNGVLLLNLWVAISSAPYLILFAVYIPNITFTPGITYYGVINFIDPYKASLTINHFTDSKTIIFQTSTPMLYPSPMTLGIGYEDNQTYQTTEVNNFIMKKPFGGTIFGLNMYPAGSDLSRSPLYLQYLSQMPTTTQPPTIQAPTTTQQPTTQPLTTQAPTTTKPPHVTSPNYVYQGCYADNSPPTQLIPNLLSNPLSNTNLVSSVDECYNLAQRVNSQSGTNYNVFGLQLGGYCYASNDTINNPSSKYSSLGNGTDCNNILGGSKSNQVYSINNTITTPLAIIKPTTTSPATTIPSDCNSIGLQPSLGSNTIQSQCNSSKNCYYVNGSCYDESRFTPLPTNVINNNFTCQIGATPKGDGYLLQCPNTDKSNYLFNNISATNDCIQSDSTCNLITMSNPNLQTPTRNNNSNPNPPLSPKLATVQYINGSFPQPLFLSNTAVEGLTDNFNNMSGNLFFSDINNNTMQVPYNIVPSINNIPSGKTKLIAPNTDLISQIQNLNASVMQNLNLIAHS